MIKNKVSISPEFKKQGRKTIISIITFLITCIQLLITIVLFSAIILYLVIQLVIAYQRWPTLGLASATLVFCAFLFYFLLKFVFRFKDEKRTDLVEIKPNEEPEFFALVNEVAQEVGADKPLKIFLSPEVNAGVNFNSVFWSMLFSRKKNLTVGVALIEILTISELKYVLAHEFGHFSQKSMRIGSYSYNAEKVIYDMLYNNERYDEDVKFWEGLGWFFGMFLGLAKGFLVVIKAILKKLHFKIRKNFLALSREMEFHADEIADHTSETAFIEQVLPKIDLGDEVFEEVRLFYIQNQNKKWKSENLYKDFSSFFHNKAQEFNLETKNGNLEFSTDVVKKKNRSKIIFEQTWSSHPSTLERIKKLKHNK